MKTFRKDKSQMEKWSYFDKNALHMQHTRPKNVLKPKRAFSDIIADAICSGQC